MKLRHSLAIFVLIAGCLGVAFAANAPAGAVSILPRQFAGWQLQGDIQTSSDPAAADSTNAVVLKEYRFTDLASGT